MAAPSGSSRPTAWRREARRWPTGTCGALPLGGRDAARALVDGEVDAAFFVVGAEAPYLSDLLADADIALLSPSGVTRRTCVATASSQTVFLPEGVLDLDPTSRGTTCT